MSNTAVTVPPLSLPNILPHPNAIKSRGKTAHSYEPEFWEFEYDTCSKAPQCPLW
jgi:hypothetical protein